MPQLRLADTAVADLERLRQYLVPRNAQAAVRAVQTIIEHLATLETHPDAGRELASRWALRELVVPFGDSGYLVLYRYTPGAEQVTVITIRHQREL